MKLKLKSARQQIKENEAARDAQFLEDYPDGRYALKLVFRSEPPMSQTYYTIHWKKQRWNRGLGVRPSLVINADAPEKSEQLKKHAHHLRRSLGYASLLRKDAHQILHSTRTLSDTRQKTRVSRTAHQRV